jgi:hypothetical protein
MVRRGEIRSIVVCPFVCSPGKPPNSSPGLHLKVGADSDIVPATIRFGLSAVDMEIPQNRTIAIRLTQAVLAPASCREKVLKILEGQPCGR